MQNPTDVSLIDGLKTNLGLKEGESVPVEGQGTVSMGNKPANAPPQDLFASFDDRVPEGKIGRDEGEADVVINTVNQDLLPEGEPVPGQPQQAQPPQPAPSNGQVRYEDLPPEVQRELEIARQLKADPDVQNLIQQKMQPEDAPPDVPPQEPIPARPKPPKKPAGYSRAEAESDPSSKSAQYFEDYANYKEELDEWTADVSMINTYNQKAVVQWQQEREAYMQEQKQLQSQQEAQLQAQNNAVRQFHQELQTQYGLNAGEASDFINWVQKQQNATDPNTWLAVWRAERQGQYAPPQVNQPYGQAYNNQQNLSTNQQPMTGMPQNAQQVYEQPQKPAETFARSPAGTGLNSGEAPATLSARPQDIDILLDRVVQQDQQKDPLGQVLNDLY